MSNLSVVLSFPPDLVNFIEQHSISEISTEYCGSGDEGYFQSTEAKSPKGFVFLEDIEESLEEAFCEILEQFAAGWEIDDGGYGEILIQFTDSKHATVSLSATTRVPILSSFTLNCSIVEV